MSKLNIGTKATSTVKGIKAKIAELEKMIKRGVFKGKKEITAKNSLAWYRSDLKHDFRGRRSKAAKKKVAAVAHHKKAA